MTWKSSRLGKIYKQACCAGFSEIMQIDRIHFYVEDAKAWRNWFVNHLGFQAIASDVSTHTCSEVIKNGSVCFELSSPRTQLSPVAQFLRQHPPGVADIAFVVENVTALMEQAIANGAKVVQSIQQNEFCKWGKIAAWGSLCHTLIERNQNGLRPAALTEFRTQNSKPHHLTPLSFTGIDHVVLNVAMGELERAVEWYQNTLGFQSKQSFKIQTNRSALHSQVLVSPDDRVQLPINQPASANSQIQEFLDANCGAGIQHIALHTANIVQNVAQFRASGLSFLPVPPSYYTQLTQRQGLPLSTTELAEIAQQQILVDWQASDPQALLLQIFTQPIFGEPTFFFEVIERRFQAPGFGEGNFRALFEAIEREQIKRGNLEN